MDFWGTSPSTAGLSPTHATTADDTLSERLTLPWFNFSQRGKLDEGRAGTVTDTID